MALNQRGKRDGTGPYKDSLQRQGTRVGKRKQAGLPCPAPGKGTSAPESRHGSFVDKRQGL